MPLVTKIVEQKRRPTRRNVHLDGAFAFGCGLNVIARFRLREGMTLSADEVTEIQRGEVRQECLDRALALIAGRSHARAELRAKLMRREFGAAVVDGVLADLERMGYVNDAMFAAARADQSARSKKHGPRRAYAELVKRGVASDVARRAVADRYADPAEAVSAARAVIASQSKRLAKLDPPVARRRLTALLARRGFDFDTIRKALDAR